MKITLQAGTDGRRLSLSLSQKEARIASESWPYLEFENVTDSGIAEHLLAETCEDGQFEAGDYVMCGNGILRCVTREHARKLAHWFNNPIRKPPDPQPKTVIVRIGHLGSTIADSLPMTAEWAGDCYLIAPGTQWRKDAPGHGFIAGIPDSGAPIPMLLHCPMCNARHVDVGEFATKPHHTHACQNCGHVWRPAIIHTVGVQFLPGFRDE